MFGVLLFGGCYNFIRTRRFTIGPARSGGPPFKKPNNSFHQNPIILAGQPCRAENVGRHFQKSKFSKLSSPRTRNWYEILRGPKNCHAPLGPPRCFTNCHPTKQNRPGPQGLLGSGGMNYWVFEKGVPRMWWAQLRMGVCCE